MKSCNEANNFFKARIIELGAATNRSAFARKCGLNVQDVQRFLDSGQMPGAHKLIAIATCFNVSADWLLGLSDQRGGQRPAEYPWHAADPPARVAESPPPAAAPPCSCCPACADKERQIDRLMRVVENLSLNQRLPSPPCSSGMAKPASSYSRRAKS